jgi:hypothetical protein
MPSNNPGASTAPLIFTSASCAVYARIHAAGNKRLLPIGSTIAINKLGRLRAAFCLGQKKRPGRAGRRAFDVG